MTEIGLPSTTATVRPQYRPSYIDIGPHHFFIPVMGTGFTVDSPLRVARYGICSVMSIGDDILLEQIRRYYTSLWSKPFTAIRGRDPEARVERIRTYLNFVHDAVDEQMNRMQAESFSSSDDIARYFALLPSGSLRSFYDTYKTCSDTDKSRFEAGLRSALRAGSADVNIMTRVDAEQRYENGKGIPETGLAMTALRGFATSKLRSSVVLSAGINKRLFAYMAQFEDFFPTLQAPPTKSIILKVSDYRSALLQGTILAKRGLWVSEFRIESGLNCGGHTFPTKGQLLGAVLEEFRVKRERLQDELRNYYATALQTLGKTPFGTPSFLLSAQGGVGTASEHHMLRECYGVDRIGWGTPFLFVPEATNLDGRHLRKLVAAGDNDVTLSEASPLGVPFWILKGTTSDEHRLNRIAEGTPGRRCRKHFLAMDSEFARPPLCRASRQYQTRKLDQIEAGNLLPNLKEAAVRILQSKTCLCMDLAGSALNRLGIDKDVHTAVCCGPSAVDFSAVYTLQEMVDHIYGRCALSLRHSRPHMFIRELSLYVDYLKKQIADCTVEINETRTRYLDEFKQGLLSAIAYYRSLSNDPETLSVSFRTALAEFEERISSMLKAATEGLAGSAEGFCLIPAGGTV
ncbi:MAG TPA: hypothetical protein PLF13_00130 [candidate division Zixibacteria bacterium]|nr:hypothetical protein [candidate division Zixibacteria bacterium]